MINSRDNHIALNGACALTNELFKYSADGSEVPYPMMYPADPSAPASEVCNCHCTYIEHVLLDDEDVQYGKIVRIDPALGKRTAEESLGFSAYNEEVYEQIKELGFFKKNGAYMAVHDTRYDLRYDELFNVEKLNELAKRYEIKGDVLLPETKAQIAEKLINEQIPNIPASKWSKKFNFIDQKLFNWYGKKEFSCDISIPKDADFHTILHELLHARSVSQYDIGKAVDLYINHNGIEEGSVEYLARELCLGNGIVVSGIVPYAEQVNALKTLCTYHGETRNIDFAKEIIIVPLEKRMQYIKDDITSIRGGDTIRHDGLDSVIYALEKDVVQNDD